MPSYSWLRLYSETLYDRKIERIARLSGMPKYAVIGLWTSLLMLANDSPERGVLLLTDEIPLTVEDLCIETGADQETMTAMLMHFERHQMLHQVDGVFAVSNWDQRQFTSDNSSERVRRWRRSQKEDNGADNEPDEAQDENECNVTVTLQQRFGNGPDTDTDTDTDTESEGSADAPPPTPPPEKRKSRVKKTTPEAVRVFRSNVHRYPPKSWYDAIETVVGAGDDDLKRWGEVCHQWVGRGYNPQNVSGMLDCYTKGGLSNNGTDRRDAGAVNGYESGQFATGLGDGFSDADLDDG